MSKEEYLALQGRASAVAKELGVEIPAWIDMDFWTLPVLEAILAKLKQLNVPVNVSDVKKVDGKMDVCDTVKSLEERVKKLEVENARRK